MLAYTTPYHSFKLPVDAKAISELYITYAQDDVVLFEKTLEDCQILEGGKSVRVLLSQEDTGTISECEHKIEVQMTVKTTDDKRFTSNVVKLKSGKVLKREVI